MADETYSFDGSDVVGALSTIKEVGEKAVSTPEVDSSIFENLTPAEAELITSLADVAIPISEFTDKYVKPVSGNLEYLRNNGGEEMQEALGNIACSFEQASLFAQGQPELQYMAAYLYYLSHDWRNLFHRFHPESLSEKEFFENPLINNGKIVVRSSPGLEEGYGDAGGYNPSFHIRIGKPVTTGRKVQALEYAIYNHLRATHLRPNVSVTFRYDNFILGAGLHRSEPSGSQYVMERNGIMYVVINSNMNVQTERNRELAESCIKSFAPGVYEKKKDAILSLELEVPGHETTEVILEKLCAESIKKLGGRREALELDSTIGFLDALRVAKNYYGREYAELYEAAVWRIISRMILRRDPKGDEKMAVYSRGFDKALSIFEESGAFYYYDDRISDINWPAMDQAIGGLHTTLQAIINSGRKSVHNGFFGIKRKKASAGALK